MDCSAGHEHRSSFVVERWTRLSAVTGIVAAVVLVVLALGPLMFDANIVDNLTTLFIYLILAVMWNALAGFAGLVSVGQQAFFGLGAYFAIQLSYHGVAVYPALLLGALHRRRRFRCRYRCLCCDCGTASSPSACGSWRS